MGLERGVESGWRASSRDHDKFPKGRFSRSFNLAGICSYFFSFKSICPCAKALLKKHCWLNHSPRTEAKRKHRCNSRTVGRLLRQQANKMNYHLCCDRHFFGMEKSTNDASKGPHSIESTARRLAISCLVGASNRLKKESKAISLLVLLGL